MNGLAQILQVILQPLLHHQIPHILHDELVLLLLQLTILVDQFFQHLEMGAQLMEAISGDTQHVRNVVLVRTQLVEHQPSHRLVVRFSG